MLRIPWPYNQNENETKRSLSCSTTALDKATRETRVSKSAAPVEVCSVAASSTGHPCVGI